MTRRLVFIWDFHRYLIWLVIIMISMLIGYGIGSFSTTNEVKDDYLYESRGTSWHAQRDYLTIGFDQKSDKPSYYAVSQGPAVSNPRGAAILEIDPQSGVCTFEAYVINNTRHRTRLPAIIQRNPLTGSVLSAEWYHLGRKYEPSEKEMQAFLETETGSQPCHPRAVMEGVR